MSALKTVALSRIDPNPLRLLDKYPYVERKIDALIRSIKTAGFWEGVIGREVVDRIQLAFGHHRIEAARRAGLTEVRMIIRELSDEEMLRFMGSENREEYSANFLMMLETWEAAVKFFAEQQGTEISANTQAIDIAKFLGWTTETWRAKQSQPDIALNLLSQTCNSAYHLIQGGYLTHADLVGLGVFAVRELCGALQSKVVFAEHSKAERHAKGYNLEHIDHALEIAKKASKHVAQGVRDGEIALKAIRRQFEGEAHAIARLEKAKPKVMFHVFGKEFADQIEDIFRKDANAEKIQVVLKALEHITEERDLRVVRLIDFQIAELIDALLLWRKSLATGLNKASYPERTTVRVLPRKGR